MQHIFQETVTKKIRQTLAVGAVSLLSATGSFAEQSTDTDFAQLNGTQPVQELLSAAFAAPPESGVFALDEEAMSTTQGELWPFIFGVATLDLTLASFYWGHYVPMMERQFNCELCQIP